MATPTGNNETVRALRLEGINVHFPQDCGADRCAIGSRFPQNLPINVTEIEKRLVSVKLSLRGNRPAIQWM